MENFGPGLYLLGTPIGNLGDISKRAVSVLSIADVIACEDTREIQKLINALEIENDHVQFISVYGHNEKKLSTKVIEKVEGGSIVVYASDAGMPTISDPGSILVETAHKKNIKVTAIPSATALTTAYALSGFASPGFNFVGFFPRSNKAALELIEHIRTWGVVTIFYESPKRIHSTLDLFVKHLPDQQMTLCRELTKKFEEVQRATPKELVNHFDEYTKGEIVVVVGPVISDDQVDESEIIKSIQILKSAGISSRDCVRALDGLTSSSKNRIKELFQSS